MASTDVLVHINMNGNEIQNVLAQKLAAAPSNPSSGQFYYNTTDNTLYVYNGTSWLNALAQGTTYTNGNGITISSNQISLNIATGANAGNVTLTADSNGLAASAPTASTSTAGLIEIATDTEASTGTDTSRAINAKQLATKVTGNTAITGATKCKITYDSKGLVTAGADLSASDIPSLSLSKISDVTATAAEVNVLDGITASTTELNYTDGVTSNIQTQLDGKLSTKPDGTNNLIDSGNKVTMTYIPDVLLGQMLYAGTFVPSTAVATLTTNAKTKLGTSSDTITLTNNTTAITGYEANEGNYYICSADGTFASISLLTGDWLVSTGSGWTKVDNTDAVTGVKGNAESTYRTGNVNITADNVLPTQTSNSGKFLTTNGTTASWGTVPDTLPTQTGNSGKYLTTNGTTPSWATVDALPSQTSQSGKFLTTNGTTASWDTAVTPDGTQTLTNKTIDADDNTISDLTTSNFKSGVVQTTVRTLGTATDTALATEAAIRKLVDDVRFCNAKSFTAFQQSALTASGGVCTWNITFNQWTNISFNTSNPPTVYVYDQSTGKQVLVEASATTTTATIKFNSSSDIAANTYAAVITGRVGGGTSA